MRQHCEKIADGPRRYVARPDLGAAIRICAHGNHLIIFEPFDDGALNCDSCMVLEMCPEFSAAPDPCFIPGISSSVICRNQVLPSRPNDLWCADYKGEFMLADRRYGYPVERPAR